MKHSSAVRAAAAILALAALGACTRVGAGGGGAGGNPWTKHGVLRIVNISEPDSLNPLVGNFQIDSDLAMLWGGFFFEFSDKNQLVPDLATSVPTVENGGVSKDGTTIDYHLRQGVKWQDGAPFSADDVIFTWHAIMNKNNNIPSTVGYDAVDRIDKKSPYEIVVHLKHQFAPFVNTFFNQSGEPYPVLPAHLLAKYPNINTVSFDSKPVGTGPFSIETWHRGSKIIFDANPNYWRGAPKLKRIEYEAIPDENTIASLLRSHDVDLEFNASAASYPQLKDIPGTTVVLTPFDQYSFIGLNAANPNLGDERVREALHRALDIPTMLRDISFGVDIAGDSDQPADSWAHASGLPEFPYDPVKARALLRAAGWIPGPDGICEKNGKRLSISIATTTGSAVGNKTAVVVQRYWRDIGVDASVKTYISSRFFATYGANGVLQRGLFDASFSSWISGIDPDDDTNFASDQIPPQGQNIVHMRDAQMDAALHTELSDPKQSDRKAAFRIEGQRLAAVQPEIVLWFARRIAVVNSDLKNYEPAHFVTSFWNPWEWEI